MRFPGLALLLALAPVGLGATLRAQAPTVAGVEPPNWWTGHSVNPVRVLVRGTNLRGLAPRCGRLACGNLRVNDRGTALFVDVTIPRGAAPGVHPIVLRGGAGEVRFDFRVDAPLPRAGRFQGFGARDVLYLLLPDRFANGDTTNDDPAKSRGMFDRAAPKGYHGGDLEGVRRRLPYLRDLGVTTIWLAPLYDNTDRFDDPRNPEAARPNTAYHGYHARDLYAVEEHYGDVAALRRLVDEAHALGLRIVLDQVANHVGPEHPWVDDPPTPTWFHGTRDRHLPNNWQVWTVADPHAAPAIRDSMLDGWFVDLLPDLNQDDPDVARYLIQNTLWWVGVSGADGIRQDTWPYVPRPFWARWMAALKQEYPALRVVGEMWNGDPALLAFFEGGRRGWDGVDDAVDHLFDFPLYYPIRGAFARGGPVREVAEMLARDRLYGRPGDLVTFLGNHDVERFMHERGASRDGLRLAWTFLLTTRGIPMLYYGDEIGLAGGPDPDNRRDFPGGFPGDPRDAFTAEGRDAAQQEVFTHVRALLGLRAARPDLATAPLEHLRTDLQVYVYRRGRTIVALNNGATPARVVLPPGAPADAAVGGCRARDGVVELPARTGCVF